MANFHGAIPGISHRNVRRGSAAKWHETGDFTSEDAALFLPSHHSAVPSKKGELSNSGFGVPELDNSRDRLPVLGDPLPRRTWGQMPLISAGLRSARGGRSYIGVVLWGLSNSGRFVLKKGKK